MGILAIGLALALTVSIQSPAFSGTERSGGNLLEAAFSKSISQIEGDLGSMGKRAKSKLKFSTEMYADASSGITVECASLIEDIDYLRRKKRLAFVKNAGNQEDKIIYLNCYNESPEELVLTPDWRDVLEGLTNKKELSTTAKVLVVHEVFRAGGIEIKEGDYSLSSSIKTAQGEQDLTIREQLVDMIAQTNKRCLIRVQTETSCGSPGKFKEGKFTVVKLLVRNHYGLFNFMHDSYTLFFAGCTSENQEAEIAQIEDTINLKLSNHLTFRTLVAAKNANCFDGR